MGQQIGIGFQHPVIIFGRDAQMSTDLPVGNLIDVKGLDAVNAVVADDPH